MRSISSDGLAKLSQRLGTEPITIVSVDWNDSTAWYADRNLPGIPGKILSVGQLDTVVAASDSTSSQSVEITLDDTDGSIKALMDNYDVHQRPAAIYQYFDGLDLDDKFLLFRGQVTTPITWNEGDRTVTFTILSQIEDREFGFSAEEGQFPLLPADMVGKPWPVIFGTVLDVPALRVTDAVRGTTLDGTGILSGAAYHQQLPLAGNDNASEVQAAVLSAQSGYAVAVSQAWAFAASVAGANGAPLAAESQSWASQANAIQESANQLGSTSEIQETCARAQRQQAIVNAAEKQGPNPIRILGGEDFPQGRLLTLNIGGGLFTGRMTGNSFTIEQRYHPTNETTAASAYSAANSQLCKQAAPPQPFGWSTKVPRGFGDNGSDSISRSGYVIPPEEMASRPSIGQVAQFFWADAGASVFIDSNEPQTYIVSIVPGTVLAVKAWKTFNQQRTLVNVPNDLWTTQSVNYGPVTAVQVTLSKPLSTITDQGWEDDLFLAFQSSVGPSITDILAWIIDNYTSFTYDADSFATAATQLAPFPANFPVLDRRNVLQLLQEISYQARCALFLKDNVFFLKYLPAEPDADDTITASDIVHRTIKVDLSSSDDISTKLKVSWHLSWAADKPYLIVLRSNVDRYGTKERDDDFYIYNQPDIVLKAVTFWLIRKSNTWKQLSFSTFLNKLNLEPFDCVTLPAGYVSTDAVKAIISKATYNSDTQSVDFVCLVPVRSGEMEPYRFFWPAALTPSDLFPTPEQPESSTLPLPIGYIDGLGGGGTVFVGGPNVVFRSGSDRGDRTPGDVGFSAQTIVNTSQYAELHVTPNPNPDLTLNYVDPPPVQLATNDPTGVVVLDTNMLVTDGSRIGPAAWQFDPETGRFYPDGAFLQD